jgi:hypothetical protein
MKKTIKRQIAEFVASKGEATRMEIIEFYVDLKNGSGHYKSNKNTPVINWTKDEKGEWQTVEHPTKTHNPFRGRLSSGFNKVYEEESKAYIERTGHKILIKKAWLMDESTNEYLVKGQDGKYQAVIKE